MRILNWGPYPGDNRIDFGVHILVGNRATTTVIRE